MLEQAASAARATPSRTRRTTRTFIIPRAPVACEAGAAGSCATGRKSPAPRWRCRSRRRSAGFVPRSGTFGAPEQDRIRIARAINQSGYMAGRRDDAEPIEHDDLADILLPILQLAEQQGQRAGAGSGQDGLRGNADAEDGVEEFPA